MGKTLLILLAGFAASFGILAQSKNQRLMESVDRMVGQYADYNAQNAAASGAFMALNKLYMDRNWRAGYNNLVIGGNKLTVTVSDDSLGMSPLAHRLKIRASAGNADASNLTQVSVFDREFKDFAVWAKDTVISITAKDSLGAVHSDLIIQKAPFMPKIDDDDFAAMAAIQSHVQNGDFTPSDNYPNGNFYFFGGIPNATLVRGDLKIKSGRTVYGIFAVRDDVILEGDAKVIGVLYLYQTSSQVIHSGSDLSESLVKGGIITWGNINGSGGNIAVQHFPAYLRKTASNFASDNPPIRVLAWK
jgi:hypothetical protein